MNDEAFLDQAYVQDGVSPVAGVLIVGATLLDHDEPEVSRLGVRRDGRWLGFTLTGDGVVAVDCLKDRAFALLHESGSIASFCWAETDLEALKASRVVIENERSASVGPLRCLRVLGDDVVAVGSVGQAFRVVGTRLETLPPLTVEQRYPTIEGLAGHSARDFVVATSDGQLAHFDGTGWTVDEFAPVESFTGVCALRRGYIACSKTGALFTGVPGAWTRVDAGNVAWWSLATHEGRLFGARSDGLFELVTSQAPRRVQLAGPAEFVSVRGGGGGVVACAGQTLGLVRDGVWVSLTT